jgi:hypothetical protein
MTEDLISILWHSGAVVNTFWPKASYYKFWQLQPKKAFDQNSATTLESTESNKLHFHGIQEVQFVFRNIPYRIKSKWIGALK